MYIAGPFRAIEWDMENTQKNKKKTIDKLANWVARVMQAIKQSSNQAINPSIDHALSYVPVNEQANYRLTRARAARFMHSSPSHTWWILGVINHVSRKGSSTDFALHSRPVVKVFCRFLFGRVLSSRYFLLSQ